MRRLRWTVGIVFVAAAAAVGAWYLWQPAKVSVVTPQRGDAAEIVYASGSVEPQTWAKVTPVVRERIVEQCNCEGSRVAQGDVLAKLDDSEARAVLGELEARQALAQEELRRLTVLAERRAASQQALDRAQSELGQIEALVAGQKARLDTYVLRAPSAGVVLRQDGEVGEVAELGTVLFWVGEPKPLLVVAEVNEEDIPRVEVGQRALLKSDAFLRQNLEAVVDSITPKGDPVTKTYRVRFRLPDDTPLRIGMSTDVNIVIRVAKNALLIPSAAMDGNKVFVVEGDKASRREIRTGIRGTNGVEVLSGADGKVGVDEKARVISPYPADLADGGRVSITAAQER
ncbi:efflux RND transporter periplasmic adaptor subunit [Mesorhizobium sp. M6A.T.Ce.TU.002.03.1.1]|uniref:Efflux transporter periplasmic adaptor subunit n=1 Tax=Mesorhizobium mediterraneum TaxID=43617 RepID=A0AB36R8Y3_9HYPH|nr:efflux transporter periplasmic adaptor subunit [Mesorhizobium mediterraneum]RUU28983.1 efflux RND transporter periplasmic adaptor subunit [Mesorhizobium sp. M6A.T.Ce.TU.016.01.1.1]RUU46421.1 efflux RND transporter periplasmic adaptor subunit [Mesorhizobium sp. M6A.T.Ce.TU.002.03.1.1]RUU49017.1 efflux RND transporter periplasmic adaptor subunit [Mesorhizobium sp. M6A.T.Ca.TU.002.02.2.1]RVB75359.1 efflux RND transporter periplasmic adaptor subunit [Mesorhizobium sp. M6A.T.Cr.TU.014.01.1.1]RWN